MWVIEEYRETDGQKTCPAHKQFICYMSEEYLAVLYGILP